MTADFRFIAHAAKRHTNVFPSGRFGDGLTQRGFTYPPAVPPDKGLAP
ncbi:hypothetical protein [Klebsiella pneumoniae IS43]|uniref:Uncharacterized protein n=1 Tax=Klebsiella pneumoniae IS43 TaxID=1432552 RepID=W1DFJ9_KLEPN|nr:hypothetical protein [Klebsiella pneumoniae IS43]